jgi:hypothetical protein
MLYPVLIKKLWQAQNTICKKDDLYIHLGLVTQSYQNVGLNKTGCFVPVGARAPRLIFPFLNYGYQNHNETVYPSEKVAITIPV